MTDSCLRPDPGVLGQEWHAVVEAEYEQVERLREWQSPDHYQPIAAQFADDPWRTGDDVLDVLRRFAGPETVWLDIGAGGGRYALPLALTSKQVIAVDPSAGMREVLRGELERHGIRNVDQHDLRWPEGSGSLQADICLAAHVGYDIRDINGFIDGMERASQERCISLMMDRAPSGGFEELWQAVHGEPRMRLPGAREFLQVLLARGAMPEITLFPRETSMSSAEHLLDSARRRLWLAEGSEKDRKLQQLLDGKHPAGSEYQLPSAVALITWRP